MAWATRELDALLACASKFGMTDILRRHPNLPPPPEGWARLVRYANRKLYDPSINRYVTFEDLKAMVADDRRFEVRHSITGELQTDQVLTAILVKMARKGALRDTEALRDFVRACAVDQSDEQEIPTVAEDLVPIAASSPSEEHGTSTDDVPPPVVVFGP